VVFAGSIAELFVALEVSDLAPRFPLSLLALSSTLPMVWFRVVRYTMMLSATMAIFNSWPVFHMDGDPMVMQFLILLANRGWLRDNTPGSLGCIHRRILWVGTLVLSAILLTGVGVALFG